MCPWILGKGKYPKSPLNQRFAFSTLEWIHSKLEWIHSSLEWIHSSLELIHSNLTFPNYTYTVSWKSLSLYNQSKYTHCTQPRKFFFQTAVCNIPSPGNPPSSDISNAHPSIYFYTKSVKIWRLGNKCLMIWKIIFVFVYLNDKFISYFWLCSIPIYGQMNAINLQRNCIIYLFISSLIYCFGIPRAHYAQLQQLFQLLRNTIHNMILSVDNNNTLLSHRDY